MYDPTIELIAKKSAVAKQAAKTQMIVSFRNSSANQPDEGYSRNCKADHTTAKKHLPTTYLERPHEPIRKGAVLFAPFFMCRRTS